MSASIELEFADGEYTFALPVPHIQELQRKCEIGIGGLHGRVLQGHRVIGNELVQDPAQAAFHVLDVVETIRHGLIGGGRGIVNGQEVVVTPAVANRLIDTYVAGQPLSANWSIAASVLIACVIGYDPPKKDEPATAPAAQAPEQTDG